MSAPFHVLFIEDNPGDARLVQEELRASGSKTPVQLEWVDRLEKGLERLGMNHIQAVLIDLHLPGSAGLESLECVLARAPHVPVIVMTGQTDEVLAMRAVQAGAQDYLVKGQVDGRLLMRSIQYAIQRKQTEMQLADALAYTERILTSSPVGILTYKLTGECMSANAYVAQMVGATVEQLLKQNFHQIESWRHSGLYALAQKAIAGKELAAADIHVMTSFGKDIWVRAQFVTFQSGGEERLLLTFGDITERKRAEEALRGSEENYRQLFEAESDAIFLIENETGQILQANHAACVLYGYTRDELLAKKNTDLSAEPQQTRHVTTETPVVADQVINIPLRFHRKKDATVFPVEITGRFFVHQGRPVHIAAIRDITERKQAEEALTASELRYRSLFESNPHPMWVYDLETLQFLAINDAAVEHYGYSQDEFLSMTIKEIRPVQDVPALMNNVAEDERILHLPAPWRHIKKDGSLIDVEITSHAVQWKDRPARLVLANDITERKRAEEKLRLSDQILQRVNALVLVADSDGNMTYISPSARTILGYEPDELLGANWWKASRAEPAAAQRERQYIRQAARREIQIPAEAYERPIQDRWGKTHWISWIDAAGPNDTLIGLGHDITERKLAEERLIQSERDLAEAQRVAKIGSWRFDSRTNAVRWSEELYRIFGVQKAAFEENHKAFLEFVHPNDRSRVEQIDQQTLITGEPFHLEYNIVTPGGEQKTISEVGYPVTDSHDAIIGLFGTAQDITERKRAEEALLEAEAKYRTLVESIPAITYVAAVDANNTTLYISPQVTQILGFTPEELTDGSNLWTRQIHPDDRARLLSELQNSRASGKPFSAEYRIFTRDGSLVWAYDTADFVRDASNQPLFLQGVMLDITERKNLEAQLRQNEATLRGFYESAPSLMGITELVGEDDILHIYDNPATCRFFGAEKDATNGRLSSELGAPAGAIREWIEHYRESEGSGLPVHFEYLHQDGEHPRWLAVTVAVILEESSSRTRFCYVAEEITERKRAEEKIILQANLLGAVGSAAIATDLVGRVIYWNPAAERLYGWSTSEALGRLITELTPAEQSEEQAQKIMEHLAEGKSWSGEFMVKRKDGSAFPAFISNSPFLDSAGNLTGMIGVSNDISHLKQVQMALQEKEQLLSEAQRIGHIGSWRYDIARDALQYSEEMYRLLDVSPEGFRHDSAAFLEAVDTSDRPMVARWMEDIRVRGQAKEVEFLVFHKNGELHYIRCRGAVEFDKAGRPASFIGTAQDVTERKLAEIQIRQQIERLTALRKVDQAISSSFDIHVTLDVLLSQLVSQLHVDAADILLLDADRQVFSYAAGRGCRTSTLELVPLRLAESQAVRERRPIHVQSLKNKPDPRLLTPLGASEGFECYFGVPLLVKGKIQGLLEIFHRTPLQPYSEWLDFLNTMAGQAAIAIENTALLENLERSNRELSQAYDATIEGWSRALDLRDKETEGHTRRVTEMTLALARKFGLPEEQLLYIRWGALLHDIGKMGVPDHILLKRGALTAEEWTIMRSHAQYAYDLLEPIHFLTPALDIPYCHHEKWDGTGYPRRLKGQEIPLAARLFAVVDVWDALRSDRPYRPAWTIEKTKGYICAQAGRHFDPRVVESFLQILV